MQELVECGSESMIDHSLDDLELVYSNLSGSSESNPGLFDYSPFVLFDPG